MSYNGTVNCRHCYSRGHNRRTCPDLTEQLRQRAQRELDENGSINGYAGGQYAKRTGKYIDGTDASVLKATRAGGKRRCKYCAKTGHNTRTCVELKTAKADAITNTRTIRENVIAALTEQGLGVGAIVTTNGREAPIGYLVTGFNWEHVTARTIGQNPNIVNLRVLNPSQVSRWQRETAVPLPPIEGVNENSWDHVELVAPVSGSAVTVASGLPEGYTEDQDWLVDQFDGAQSPDYHENYYA
jgi:hypothetical protein